MQKEYLECGKIVSTHGVRGEVRVQPWSDQPDFLCHFRQLYLGRDRARVEVEGVRVHKSMVLLKLVGVDALEQAAALRGRVVFFRREDAPPDPEGVFFIQDLLGLSVVDADTGRVWGKLTDVFPTGANHVYQLTDPEGVERLFPAIKDVVVETDPQGGVMRIRPLPGLFDDGGDQDAD